MQQPVVHPQIVQNEPDSFFLLETAALNASIKHIQRLLRTLSLLAIQHQRPPLLPALITNHHNALSLHFGSLQSPLQSCLERISSISTDLNQRAGLVHNYTYACKNTQKVIENLRSLRQKTVIDNRKVDLAMTDLSFQKNVENQARDALDKCSVELKRDIAEWRQGYERLVTGIVSRAASGQQRCHQDAVETMNAALEVL